MNCSSTSAANASLTTVAEALPLNPDKTSEGVAVIFVVLDAYTRGPKCSDGVKFTASDKVDNDPRSAANRSGAAVNWIAEVLALGPEKPLGREAGVGSLGAFEIVLAKPIRSGSCWINGYDNSLFALLVNDRFNGSFVLLLCFE